MLRPYIVLGLTQLQDSVGGTTADVMALSTETTILLSYDGTLRGLRANGKYRQYRCDLSHAARPNRQRRPLCSICVIAVYGVGSSECALLIFLACLYVLRSGHLTSLPMTCTVDEELWCNRYARVSIVVDTYVQYGR